MDEFESPPTDKNTLIKGNYSAACESNEFDQIEITDSVKGYVEGSSATGKFVTYGIKFENFLVRRRYSDFESLRNYFLNSYPTVVIPPIPDKHTFGDYANIAAKSKKDEKIVEIRKRLLQSFLNHVLRHPTLSGDHLFHRFLEADVSWTDILLAENIKTIKISKVKGKGTVDPRFVQIQNNDAIFGEAVSRIEKINKKMGKKYHTFSEDIMDLGAALNGFSLEDNVLAPHLEILGQGFDSSQAVLEDLAHFYSGSFADALNEMVLYSKSVKQTLNYRQQQQIVHEEVCDELIAKKNQLVQLEAKKSRSGLQYLSSSAGDLNADPENSKNNAILKLKDIIEQLEESKIRTSGDLQRISEEIEQEITRYSEFKSRDWTRILSQFVKQQIKYHEDNVNLWQNTVNSLNQEINA